MDMLCFPFRHTDCNDYYKHFAFVWVVEVMKDEN